jgi:hypothetical protein
MKSSQFARPTHGVAESKPGRNVVSAQRTLLTACRCLTILAGIVASASLACAQQVTAASENQDRAVIVIMKNRLTGADALNDQAPVVGELSRAKARNVKSYRLVNAFATTVSEAEMEHLKVHPAVAQVVPDSVIRLKAHIQSAVSPASSPATSLTPNVIPGACGSNGQVLLDPEALLTTNTDSDNPAARTARSLGFTGAGVKVAFIADGVDPNNVNFIRQDGKSVFVDYQDFSGDGPNASTGGGEAFEDSNAIAGQGIFVYNVSGFAAQTDPSACNIRIEGVAPGAQLVGLKVFSEFNYTTTSNFLEAIDYAVFTDRVDVLSESVGSNPVPAITAQDVFKLFNDAAVRAGVTVTVSSGDAGSTNTIASPASDPLVISVGASTTFRFYAQTNVAAARYFATTGWLNDNISSISSGGFNETGGTVDLVAPGDTGWASCDASSTYTECQNYLRQPSNIESSLGTSLSAPLTAGAAALVIQAYRNSHHGASPTPALVKQILTSTATDLGVPATEQGAGLLNSYKAVLLAQSIDNDSNFNTPGFPTPGQSLLLSVNQLNAVGAPGTFNNWPVTVTNPSAAVQFVQVSGRTFGPAENLQTGNVTLNDSTNPQFVNWGGLENNYGVFKFYVQGSADRLNASIAYPGTPANSGPVCLILIDPQGRFAAFSLQPGISNFGNVDVREPASGAWTGVIFGLVASAGGINGTIPWQVSTQRFVSFGSVSPSSFNLNPGESRTITVTASTPSTPGDSAGSIVLTSSGGGVDSYVGAESNSIPVTLRSLVDLDHGGSFSGVLTGGNGRSVGGPVNYYQFNVGPGHNSIMANVSLTNDASDAVGAYLVSPDGDTLGFGQNSDSNTGASTLSLTANTLNPVAGSWTLIVDFADPTAGNEISQPFTGNIKLDNVNVSAPGLPNSPAIKLKAGAPVTVPVTIRNNGAAPQAVFIDARLNTTVSLPLVSQAGLPGNYQYSLPLNSYVPVWFVPTQTSSVQAVANANVPIEFQYSPDIGDPDLFGAPAPKTSTYNARGSYTPAGGTVSAGLWYSSPSEIGPYPAAGAPAGQVSMSLTATMKAFDPAVTSTTGDLWLYSLNAFYDGFAPTTINPGQTAVINVTITPSGASGTVVTGNLYVGDFLSDVPPYSYFTGNELAAVPYTYTVK